MVIGLTGISGAGKHTAADFFAQHGWVIMDVDKIAHHLYRPYTHVWKGVVDRFGEKILNKDDTINRQMLGEMVFDDTEPEKAEKDLMALNQIVHPAIKRQLTEDIHRHFRRQSNIMVVAALWDALELRELTDKILLIKAKPELRLERIKKRDNISEGMFAMRVKHQTEPKSPDFIVENNGTVQAFYKALKALPLGQ